MNKIYLLEYEEIKGKLETEVFDSMVIVAKNKKDAVGLSQLEACFYISKKEYEKQCIDFKNEYSKTNWRDTYEENFDTNQSWTRNPSIRCISRITFEEEGVISSSFIAI